MSILARVLLVKWFCLNFDEMVTKINFRFNLEAYILKASKNKKMTEFKLQKLPLLGGIHR